MSSFTYRSVALMLMPKPVDIGWTRAHIPKFNNVLRSNAQHVPLAAQRSNYSIGRLALLRSPEQDIGVHQYLHHQRSGYMLSREIASSERRGVFGKLRTQASNSLSQSSIGRAAWSMAWSRITCARYVSSESPRACAAANRPASRSGCSSSFTVIPISLPGFLSIRLGTGRVNRKPSIRGGVPDPFPQAHASSAPSPGFARRRLDLRAEIYRLPKRCPPSRQKRARRVGHPKLWGISGRRKGWATRLPPNQKRVGWGTRHPRCESRHRKGGPPALSVISKLGHRLWKSLE